MTALLAAAGRPEPQQLGNFIGLMIGLAVIAMVYNIHQRWMRLRGEDASPTSEAVALEGVKPQVSDPSDPKMTPSKAVAVKADPDLDEFVQSNVGKMRRKDIISNAMAKYRRSESTIIRAYKRATAAKQ